MVRGTRLIARPRPAAGYEEAVKRIAALQALDPPGVNPTARLQFLTHGRRVERAVVFFHGYTNSPPQFARLGALCHERGYNVLIPRAPHHGLADRLTADHALLTAEELVALTGEAVDIARGLGEQVTVVGLSMGGVMAGWAAQERADVDRAVLIAPAFGFRAVPAALSPLAAALIRRMPNVFVWWDPVLKAKAPGPPYAYPRYATHAVAQIYRLASCVRSRARRVAPQARSIVLVTNAADLAVDNGAADRLVGLWRAGGARNLDTYRFPAELQLPHDIIDPGNAEQRIDITYPVLMGFIAPD